MAVGNCSPTHHPGWARSPSPPWHRAAWGPILQRLALSPSSRQGPRPLLSTPNFPPYRVHRYLCPLCGSALTLLATSCPQACVHGAPALILGLGPQPAIPRLRLPLSIGNGAQTARRKGSGKIEKLGRGLPEGDKRGLVPTCCLAYVPHMQ